MVYFIPKLTIVPLVKLWTKKVNGLENIPKKSPFIIAANHASYLDHLIIASTLIPYLNKKIHFLAKKEHFHKTLERWWHIYAGAIPLDRQVGGEEALNKGIGALKRGKIMAIYPEGTRSLTGKIQKGKTGIARLALGAKVPVIPLGIIGSFEILPKGKIIPKMKRATLNFGNPIYFNKYYNKPTTKKSLRSITNTIMKQIAKLSNQRYNF
jgi:1-acyl-sn-glycerol-3-phosphate acyltransferase